MDSVFWGPSCLPFFCFPLTFPPSLPSWLPDDLFINTDATQVEINPLSEGSYVGRESQPEDTVFCVDCKLNFDDNAEYRQKDIYGQRDKSMEDPRDVEADEVGVQYIGLDGNIGCMVNGAGLAMAS